VDGTVVRGDGRGRGIGVPTANLDVANETVPGGGVYACWCRVMGDASPPRAAAVNIGRRPTFGGGVVTVEAHVLDYEGDLYGRILRLEFEERLREEKKFPDADALVAQIRRDIGEARRVLRAP